MDTLNKRVDDLGLRQDGAGEERVQRSIQNSYPHIPSTIINCLLIFGTLHLLFPDSN